MHTTTLQACSCRTMSWITLPLHLTLSSDGSSNCWTHFGLWNPVPRDISLMCTAYKSAYLLISHATMSTLHISSIINQLTSSFWFFVVFTGGLILVVCSADFCAGQDDRAGNWELLQYTHAHILRSSDIRDSGYIPENLLGLIWGRANL